MKKILCFSVIVFLFVCRMDVSAMELSAASAIVMEGQYGTVIYEKDAHTRRTMASTTKIVTALCALEAGKGDDIVKIVPEAVGVEGSSIYLTNGEELTLRDLTYGLMLNSGNDAAVAIAHHLSGGVKEFAKVMNSVAERVGAVNTHFSNPNGLDEEGHYTTAYDLGLLTCHALKNDEFRNIAATYQTTIPGSEEGSVRYLTNHNKLLKRMEGCIGVKTGFTKKSGRCLVSAAERNGITLVVVTLNAPDDWNDHTKLMDYGFERVYKKQLVSEKEFLQSVAVTDGKKSKVSVVCKEDFCVPATEGRCYVTHYKTVKNLKAPVKAGDKVGEVKFYLDGKCIGTMPAVAGESVALSEKRRFSRSIVKILKSYGI